MEIMLDVPYRCPRCGGTRTFSTLADLKSHMAEEHAYSAQRRQRLKIFDYNTPRFSSTSSGRQSPLLQSFLDEGKRLEEEVKAAKKQELSNKLERHKQVLAKNLTPDPENRASSSPQVRLSPAKQKVNFTTPSPALEQDSYLQETFSNLNNEIITQRHNNWRTADALYSTQDVLSGVEEAAEGRVSEQRNVIGRLTQELAEKERQIQILRLELQKVREKGSLEDIHNNLAVDSSVQHEKECQKLEDELAHKNLELEKLNRQLTKAKQADDRRTHREESARKAREGPEKIHTADGDSVTRKLKGHTPDSSLNNEEDIASDVSTSQTSVTRSHSIRSTSSAKDRSNTLKKLKQNLVNSSDISSQYSSALSTSASKSRLPSFRSSREQLQAQKLKEDKRALIEQMKGLLSKATTENEKLKGELLAKESQLQVLNQQLERTKNDQTELMEETFDLYKEAENSLGQLKDLLRAKEAQLEQANQRMEEIREEQQKLAAEKQNITHHAGQKDSHYQNMLKERDEQIKRLNHLLASQQEERDRLTEMAAELKREVQDKEKAQQDLSKAIADKEEELKKARDDVEALSTFLQTAAAKESVARSKLEAFVTELIDRADRAERELRHLRGLERSSSGNLTSDLSQAHPFQPNISAIPSASVAGMTSLSQSFPRHSTSLKHSSRGQAAQADARHILQTSLEPWYNNLGTYDIPPKPARTGLVTGPNTPNLLLAGAGSHPTTDVFTLPYLPQPPPEPPQIQPPQSSGAQLFYAQNEVTYSDSPRLYPYTEPQPLPVSESSEEFAPSPPRHSANLQQRQPGQSHPNYNDGDSPLHASAAPSHGHRGAAFNTNQNNKNPWGYQTYDVTQVSPRIQNYPYSDSSSTYPSDIVHAARLGHSGRLPAHDRKAPLPFGVNPLPPSQKKSDKSGIPSQHISGNLSRSPGKQSQTQSRQKAGHQDSVDSTDTVDGAKAISPDRTYSIFSVTGEEAKDICLEPFSPESNGSDHSGRSTPCSEPLHADLRHKLKGKVRPSARPVNKHQAGKMHAPEDSSTDGLELSIDDNGIMWEEVNSLSDLSESYRMSPYGSETAGDVDSSVLLSSHSFNNQGISKAHDTDEELEVFDDADFIQAISMDSKPTAHVGSSIQSMQDKKSSQLPLGERISKILKCVSKDSDNGERQRLPDNKSGKREMGKNFSAEKNLHPPSLQTDKDIKPRGESPLERALAVQDRVKCLTFPREKKSVTIYDTSTAELADKPADAENVEKPSRPVRKPRRKAESFRSSKNKRVEFESLEDFSCSSYASVNMPLPMKREEHSPTPIPELPDKKMTGRETLVAQINPFTRGSLGGPRKPNEDTKQISAQNGTVAKTSFQDNFSMSKPEMDSAQKPAKEELAQMNQLQLQIPERKLLIREKNDVTKQESETVGKTAGEQDCREMSPSQAEEHKLAHGNPDAMKMENAYKASVEEQVQAPAKPARSGNFLQVAFNGIMQKIGIDTSDSASKQAQETQNEECEENAINVKPNPVTVISPLQRQASIMTDDSSDMKKYENAALVPAKQLRTKFSQAYRSSLQSSSDSLSSPMPRAQSPPLPRPPSPQDKADNDSTDFDLESDLEKFTAPGGGSGMGAVRWGLVTGKPASKKALQKKTKTKRSAASRNTRHMAAPDESSSAVSDGETQSKLQREERKRRRVALFHVFSYLDTRTLCKMARVCKEWQRVSRHPALWKNVHLKYDHISSQYLITISKWCTQLTSLTFEGLRAGSRRADETLDEYHRRTRGSLEPGLEVLLKTSQDSLTSLSIIACGNILTEKCMWLVSGYCRLLRRLTYVSDTNPLTAEVMWALGGGCPSITSLFIPPLFPCTNTEAMTNRCLLLLAQFYPDMQEVGVGGRAIDVTGLVPLVQSCQRLHVLSLDHIREMGDDTATALCRAGLRQMQRLEVTGTPITANAIKTFYNSCRHLKEIKITVCIADMFDDVRKKKNKEQYKKVVQSLGELKSQAGLGIILHLQATPLD